MLDKETRLAFDKALELHRHGDTAAAEAAYRALYEQQAHPKLAHMLGLALHQQQRSGEALKWFERAAVRPTVSFHANYAAALLALGRGREAEAQSRLALALLPSHPGARLNLALALETQERFEEAASEFAALTSAPGFVQPGQRGRIRCLLHLGEIEQARDALGETKDGDTESALLRGEIALEAGELDLAESAFNAAAESSPTNARATVLQARLAQQRADHSMALSLLERAIERDREDRTATLQNAAVLLECGEVAACLDRLRGWIAEHPADSEAHSLYLRGAQYSPDFDAAKLLAAHRGWAQKHASPVEFVAPRERRADEPLRIGWLSPAFRNGPLQSFFLSTLSQLGERGLSFNVLYNSNPRRNPSSAGFRAAADRWEDVGGLDDEALVRRMREDAIDVLVDLAGHARGGRLTALSRRAAPVQITWLDSFGTTGIDAMDFVLTDEMSSPPGCESGFTEHLLRLPHGRLCYLPPVPAERPDPSARRLISLNHLAKLNDQVIDTWGKILQALPGWTLYLQARGADDAAVVAKLRERFARNSLAPRRIECAGYSSLPLALRTYRDAAIALDPFPFAGGANSCDALWMGLPLVSCPRDTLISRQGASLLHALDRERWIARDVEDYVAIAVALATDVAARRRWAETAAARVAESLGDASRFTTELVAALEEAWKLRASEGFPAVSR